MGFFEKDKNNVTGNSINVDDLTFTWDEEEELLLEEETPVEKTVTQPKPNKNTEEN